MNRIRSGMCAVLLGLGLSVSSFAATYNLYANLTPDAETTAPKFTMGSLPAAPSTDPRPASFGRAVFTLNTDDPSAPFMTMMTTIWNIDVTGSQTPTYTNDDLLNAHIHASPLVIPLPLNFGVRWGFFGSPDNDINPKQLVVTPFAGGVGGTFTSIWDAPEGNNTTLAAQIANILEGRSYINFHTVENPGGEIRGTLQLVPEPATTGFMALGLGAFALRSLRRRKQ